MKRLIIAAAILATTLSGCAGMAPATDEQRKLEKVFDAPGMSKDQIYQGIKIWIAENFVSAKAVIEHDNREDGTLIGNTMMKWPCGGLDCIAKAEWKMASTYRFDVKDGRFKIQAMNVRITWPPKYPSPGADIPINSADDFDLARGKLAEIGTSITASISNNSTAKQNW
jgi:hypothetical protein